MSQKGLDPMQWNPTTLMWAVLAWICQTWATPTRALPGELAEREADPRGRAQAEGGQARPLAQVNPLNR